MKEWDWEIIERLFLLGVIIVLIVIGVALIEPSSPTDPLTDSAKIDYLFRREKKREAAEVKDRAAFKAWQDSFNRTIREHGVPMLPGSGGL